MQPGEIHALLGENGAGKSTLIRIMSGALSPDAGGLRWNGEPAELSSPLDALKLGIAVVHQELALMPHRTVAENLYLSTVPTVGGRIGYRLGLVSRRKLSAQTREFLKSLEFDLSPDASVGTLNQSQRQLVEIARALAQDARLILLDEPTSALPPDERRDLMRRIGQLRERGFGIVFVTHLLAEAHEMADRITVLRDGRNVGTRASQEVDLEGLISMMTGKAEGDIFPSYAGPDEEERIPRLEVRRLASEPSVRNVSFAVFPGEIIGLAGLIGAGRTGVLETIFGVRSRTAGEILIDGRSVGQLTPLRAIEAGMAFIPEDRQADGLFPEQSVRTNIVVATSQAKRGASVTRLGRLLLSAGRARHVASRLIHSLDIRVPNPELPVHTLSGGNQQKVVLARWLATDPSIVLADDPTRGVSIGSKIEIYKLFEELAASGAAIVVVSSEFEELLGLCNRILIIHEGANVSDIKVEPGRAMDADALLHLVLGAAAKSKVAA